MEEWTTTIQYLMLALLYHQDCKYPPVFKVSEPDNLQLHHAHACDLSAHPSFIVDFSCDLPSRMTLQSSKRVANMNHVEKRFFLYNSTCTVRRTG